MLFGALVRGGGVSEAVQIRTFGVIKLMHWVAAHVIYHDALIVEGSCALFRLVVGGALLGLVLLFAADGAVGCGD